MGRNLINIGLDYDGTVTSDPTLFIVFAQLAKARGHKVYLVTMRFPSECSNIPEELRACIDKVVATSRTAKKPFMQTLGIPVHVWIDDEPRALLEDASAIWGDISPEGSPIVAEHGTPAPT